jgi:anti-sigma B factor antagonist
MVLQIKREEMPPDIVVLQVAGKLVLGRDAKELEWAVDELVKKQGAKVILDLANLSFVDSTGIGIIVMCSGKVKSTGGEIRLAGCKGMVEDVLRRTRIDAIVPFCQTREHAAESLKGASQAGAGGAQA